MHIPAQKLLTHLSFTHLAELIKIDNPVKRTLYEAECIKGGWAVRELKRKLVTIVKMLSKMCGIGRDMKTCT